MTTTDYTERYVAAAMRTVPEAQRADLGAELRGSIDDQIDARVDNGEAFDEAEKAVLTELGDPEKLAAGYTDRKLSLIGPRYYLDWWRLLKLLWAIVPVCAVVGVSIGMTIAGEGFGAIMGTVWSVLISSIVHVGFWTTLVFVIVERTEAHANRGVGTWTLEQLPQLHQRGVGFPELVANLVFLVLIAGALLWDRFIGFVPGFGGLSFFDDGLWPWWMLVLAVLMLCEAALSIVVYLRGRWTIGLAVGNAVLALAVAVPAVVLVVQGRLLNPDFFPTLLGESGGEVGDIVRIVAGFLIAGIALWDIIDVALKTARARRP
jgi:hypothetical protein